MGESQVQLAIPVNDDVAETFLKEIRIMLLGKIGAGEYFVKQLLEVLVAEHEMREHRKLKLMKNFYISKIFQRKL